MRPFCSPRTFAALALLGMAFCASQAAAYPHRGEFLDRTQPDGTQVQVVLWGDEFYVQAETPNGYTVVVDPTTDYICYALETSDGDLISSGIVYDGVLDDAALSALGLTKGVTISAERRAALSEAKRSRLSPDVSRIVSQNSLDGRYYTGNMQLIAQAAPAGTVTGLVVLVDFPDRRNTIATTEVENAFNSTGAYGSTWHGSIRRWSEQISTDITSVQHKVTGYYTAKYDVAHYNAPTAEWDYSTADELYQEVYAYVDANVDLSSYALNGKLPSLAVIYAGEVIARDWAMALWPHGGCGGRGYRTSEGVQINQCFMTNLGTRTPIALSTFRHELGHSVFLWPDTYDYDNDSQSGGGFATETDMPCAPFRMWAGWISPNNVTTKTGVFPLDANGASFLRFNNTKNAKEYFIAEYAKRSTQRSPPDEGLLIWHIDEAGDNSWQDMTATRHYAMSVEQADGAYHLEKNVRAGSGDLYHEGYVTEFNDTTAPSANFWNGTPSGFKLCEIGGITTTTMSVNVGCVAAGGSSGTGGASSVGGATAKGGASSVGGTTAKGGASSVGGTTAKGGSSSLGSGGSMSASGGTVSASGGSTWTIGGANGSLAGAGGSTVALVGTAVAVGGNGAFGGVAPAVDAIGGAGGATVNLTGTTVLGTTDNGDDEGGCGCRTAGTSSSGHSAVFFGALAALSVGLRRRRRS